MHGALLVKQGCTNEGIAQMCQGLEAMRTNGAGLNRADFPAQLAASAQTS